MAETDEKGVSIEVLGTCITNTTADSARCQGRIPASLVIRATGGAHCRKRQQHSGRLLPLDH